jgi:hypothetical protein
MYEPKDFKGVRTTFQFFILFLKHTWIGSPYLTYLRTIASAPEEVWGNACGFRPMPQAKKLNWWKTDLEAAPSIDNLNESSLRVH